MLFQSCVFIYINHSAPTDSNTIQDIIGVVAPDVDVIVVVVLVAVGLALVIVGVGLVSVGILFVSIVVESVSGVVAETVESPPHCESNSNRLKSNDMWQFSE